MDLGQVTLVLDALSDGAVRWWIGGGWGVDVLVGRETREHRDLDLAIDAEDEKATLDVLYRLGFVIETDWRPARFELAAAPLGWVDLHPVRFDDNGHGRQEGLVGDWFDYPESAFTTGTLGGREVPCLSVEQQLVFHQGYELREVDHHDLALLHALQR